MHTSLKSLSDELLDQSLFTYVKKEKEILKEILCHIAEVDRRRLYLTLGYSSLYVYLTERMGYEGGSAQRRLDAARLLLAVPIRLRISRYSVRITIKSATDGRLAFGACENYRQMAVTKARYACGLGPKTKSTSV